MDRLGRKIVELLRGGADPRRADLARRHRDDVSASVHVRSLNAASASALRSGLGLGALLGIVSSLVAIGAYAALTDRRLAPAGDIAMARQLRAALPHPERLTAEDFVRRLAVPLQVGRLVAPLVDPDQSAASRQAATYAVLEDQLGLAVDPGRLEALIQLARRLAGLLPQQRADHLDTIIELDRALRDPGAATILHAIAGLSPGDRATLSETRDFPFLLAEIAELPPAKRKVLRQLPLATVIPDDGLRAELLRMLSTLDPPAVSLLVEWRNATPMQHQLLVFVMDEIEKRDPALGRLLGAFWMHNPSIMRALSALRPGCSYADAEPCR